MRPAGRHHEGTPDCRRLVLARQCILQGGRGDEAEFRPHEVITARIEENEVLLYLHSRLVVTNLGAPLLDPLDIGVPWETLTVHDVVKGG